MRLKNWPRYEGSWRRELPGGSLSTSSDWLFERADLVALSSTLLAQLCARALTPPGDDGSAIDRFMS
jgi:hypothetical protein